MIRLAGGNALNKVYTHTFTYSDTGPTTITINHNLNLNIIHLSWFVTSGGSLFQVDSYYQNQSGTVYGYRWSNPNLNQTVISIQDQGTRVSPSGPSYVYLFA
jgi:hypothetical protein